LSGFESLHPSSSETPRGLVPARGFLFHDTRVMGTEIVPHRTASDAEGRGRGPPMNPTVRLGLGAALAVAGVALLLAGPTCFTPNRGEPGGVASWDDGLIRFPGDEGPRRQHQAVDNRQRVILRRIQEKMAVAEALARGELSLTQAVERFRELAAGDRGALVGLRAKHPDASDEELFCRSVLGFVRPVLQTGPLKNRDRLDRLEHEFRLRFPGPTPKVVPSPPGLASKSPPPEGTLPTSRPRP
jgi:hypothetical protein